MKDISIHIYFVNAVIKHAALQGYNTERLLQRSRISPRLINQGQARVNAEQFARLQTVTMREMADEMLGYCSRPAKLGQWSALTHWMIHSRTLGQALKRCCSFYGMVESGLQPNLMTDADKARLVFKPHPENKHKLAPYTYELFMFNIHHLICWLTESVPTTQEITFSYPKPDHALEYPFIFLTTDIHFDAPVCSFVFKRTLLARPITQTAETLDKFLSAPLHYILKDTYQTVSWTQRVKDLIGKDLSKLPSFLEIAKSLDINPKKLRRSLQAEGLSYSDLKLQLRRDIAIYYLSKQDTSVEKIAFKTGFSEASAFIRAFKTWTGVTPHTYRKDLS